MTAGRVLQCVFGTPLIAWSSHSGCLVDLWAQFATYPAFLELHMRPQRTDL